jgi:hypothetical protein
MPACLVPGFHLPPYKPTALSVLTQPPNESRDLNKRVEIVVAEKHQVRSLPGAAHRAQVIGQQREKLALAMEPADFGQEISGDIPAVTP